MKKTLAWAIALSISPLSFASNQSKLDLGSRAALRLDAIASSISDNSPVASKLKSKASNASATIRQAFVAIADGHTADELLAEGMTIKAIRGNIALVEVNSDEIERLSTITAVKQMQLPRQVKPKMNRARALTGIDKAHAGEGLSQPYTGKGVLTGIVDNGFDPLHLNFLDENGRTRVQAMSYFGLDNTGQVAGLYWSADDMDDFIYDTESTFHGTHTMGIMAGGYKGKIKSPDAATSSFVSIDNPYYGAAPEADIVASTGELNDYFIALGCEQLLNYAAYAKKPIAINLSLGGQTGPHDGTSIMCRYLDAVIEDEQVNALVCVSSGNEGDLPIVIKHEFAEDDEEVKTIIYPYYYADDATARNFRYGNIYIYSDTEQEFEFQAMVVNKATGRPALRLSCSGDTQGVPVYYASSADYAQSSEEINASFGRRFDGYIGVGSTFDEESGRYYGIFDYATFDSATGNANGQYVLGLLVKGKKGQKIDVYCDGNYTYLDACELEDKGFIAGSTDGTISDMATGKHPIIVGSYNVRDSWLAMDGNAYGYEGEFDNTTVSDFTSYGTLADGTQLPHVCAPGATIISSSNEYFLNAVAQQGADPQAYRQAVVETADRHYSWQQSVGTSMACPVVTGTLALWLEADPTLTNDEAKEILMATALRDNDVTGANAKQAKQFGAGKLDAYAGLKEVVRRQAGVDNVKVDSDCLMVKSLGNGQFDVFFAGAQSLNAEIYSIDGRLMLSETHHGDSAAIDASRLSDGVYVIAVNGATAKVVVRH